MNKTSTDFDYLLIGGGLQNGLIALALRQLSPSARLAIVERSSRLGGNHTWCFHADDVTDEAARVVEPLLVHRWPGYDVRFPRHTRRLDAPYAAVTSARFDETVRARVEPAPGCAVFSNCEAVEVADSHVTLADGRQLHANVVVDARGPARSWVEAGAAGFQKFVGLEVCVPNHGVERPVLMDALVDQIDGFRFMYVLPFGPDHLLLEDTRFADGPELDVDDLTGRILDYADHHGFVIDHVVRTEKGVLPLPWSGDVLAPAPGAPLVGGYQGGWFHPVTGYSFPVAMQLAMYIATTPIDEVRGEGLDQLIAHQRRQLGFCHRLNRMLFTWFAPAKRFNVLERFYTLPEAVVRRFYAMQLTRMDRARIMVGRPPRGMSYRAALFGRNPV